MHARSVIPWLLLSAIPLGATELDELRGLEQRIVRTIEAGSRAFVFLEGGSGFLISDDGYVLTNAHVVADEIGAGNVVGKPRRKVFNVYVAGGKAFVADLVGSDPEGDIALLKLRERPGVPALELGD